MTDRERLIELIYSANNEFTDENITEENAVEILADYLLDHGVIVPPCGRVNTIAEHTDIWNLPKTISAKPSFSPVKKRKKR